MDQTVAKSAPRPAVSVVMPVWNGQNYLRASLDSLMSQTLANFEVILINDGSTDDTAKIARSYHDPRIRLYNQTNHGLVYSLNRGIELAKSPYIARMDDDDISLPGRLEAELAYMEAHPDVVMVGACFEVIDTKDRVIYLETLPGEDEDIKRAMYLLNQFGHGTVMMRKSAVQHAGGYDPEFRHIEDYDLWTRLHRLGPVAILPQVLYRWRANEQGISHQHADTQHKGIKVILGRLWQSPPPAARRSVLRRQAEHYRGLPELGAKLQKRYLQNELSLGWQMIQRGHIGRGLSQLWAVATIGGSSTAVTINFLARGFYRFCVHKKNQLLGLHQTAS